MKKNVDEVLTKITSNQKGYHNPRPQICYPHQPRNSLQKQKQNGGRTRGPETT
jgi:hypothetical protein